MPSRIGAGACGMPALIKVCGSTLECLQHRCAKCSTSIFYKLRLRKLKFATAMTNSQSISNSNNHGPETMMATPNLDLVIGLHGGARGHHLFQDISCSFHGILLNLHPIEAFLCGGTSRALLCSTISAMSKTKKSSLILCGHSFGQVVIAE